jgi:putative ABC transport system permease protein
MFRRRRSLDDFTDEIESHLQLEVDRLQQEGLSPEAARAAARRAFGSVTASRERFYEARRWMWSERLAQDVRYALRMLRKSPAFTATVVLTLAVGIGATTAVFSVVDATLLHPLPFPDPDRLVSVQDDLPGAGSYDVGLSQPEWRDLERSGIFAQVALSWFDENNLTGASRPIRVRLASVSPNYFAMLGVDPQLGRTFPPDARPPGYSLEVVISDGMWKRELGGDPNVLNRNVRLDTDLYRIVGVMPRGFHPPGVTSQERNVDVWAGFSFYGPPISNNPPRNIRNIPGALARLKPGLTLDEAQRRLDAFTATLRSQYPEDYPAQSRWTIRLVPLTDTIFGAVRRSLTLLLAAVGLVLLLVCVNVANLLLARASARGRELAVRQAVGAGRGRLVRQLLTESAVLSAIGGGAALAILFAAKGQFVELVPDGLPRLNDIAINWSVLLFALGATTVAAVVFGVAPAVHTARSDVMTVLKSETRASTGAGDAARARGLLVVAQFALSVVLMVAAGLLARSFWDLLHVGLGFTAERVMTVRTRLPYPNDVRIDKYPTTAQQAPFFREVVRRVGTLPGVEDVALGSSTAIPLDHSQRDTNLVPLLIERRGTDPTQAPLVEGSVVTPEYFDLLHFTLLRGRLFSNFDSETQPAVAVINDAMAQTFWPGADPIGQRVTLSRRAKAWTTIVGIIANARTDSLEQARVPMVYSSAYQDTSKHLAIFVRGHLDVAATTERIRDQIQHIDDTLPVFGAQALEDTVSASLAARRFSMEIVGLFALTALVLAGMGIYGVMCYNVSERTREIGIRLALGADRRTIIRLVLRDGLRLALTGAALGLFGAVFVSRAMADVLFGVHPHDVMTFTGVTLMLGAVTLAACYSPARRAMRLDPSRIL